MTDVEYFTRRAEQEAYLAMEATNADAVAAHYQMSKAYLDRLYAQRGAGEQDGAE